MARMMFLGDDQYRTEVFLIILLTTAMLFLLSACIRMKPSDPKNLPDKTSASSSAENDSKNYLLKIDLQDGFSEDMVRIMLNGKPLTVEKNVSTSMLLGFAKSIETTAKGHLQLKVEIENRGMSLTKSLEIDADTYIGISIVDGQFQFILRDQPFGYS